MLELSDQTCQSLGSLSDGDLAKKRLIASHYIIQDELLSWYGRLQSHTDEPLFNIKPTVGTGYSLLPEYPEVGVFSGSIIFLNGYIFELLLLYWYGSLLLYTAMAQVYRQVQHNEIGYRYHTLNDVERLADNFATKICQAVEFCEKPSVGPPGFQIILPGLWAAQQFFDGRSPQKFRWCREIIKALEKKGFLSGSVIAHVSHQNYADMAESIAASLGSKDAKVKG